MANVTKVDTALQGAAFTWQAAAGGGDTLVDAYGALLLLRNTGGVTRNVTLDSVELSNFGTDVNVTVPLVAGQYKVVGPITARFLDVSNNVAVTYDNATGVELALIAGI